MTNTPNKQCILTPRESHASGVRMDIGFRIRLSDLALSENGDAKYWCRRWCNDAELKSDVNQAKIHTQTSNDNDWRLAA